jgi:hypothetical protein
MTPVELTVLTADGTATADAVVEDDRILVASAVVAAATGWEPKPEGLCRGDLCVPLRDPAARDSSGRYDLARVAAALQRPFAAEQTERDAVVASLGEAAHERAAAYQQGTAPHLELVDLDGRPVTVPDHSRRKRLLLAWSSW